ncbi:hypothetical protein P7H16_18890 [Paenibacillus larvae]|nr:hypothetical protein [Paenibacillus larvae]MDT2248570.1 hypothetical protein [Paenibacillus larvae]MDT2266275.1 hypothetical protein [Paenibacillus larvae]MDT2287995.1 hypothetical protein [Paenibacillus larvae]
MYYKRGKLPPEDKKIGGKVYWFIDTVEQYIQDLLKATGTEKDKASCYSELRKY